MIVGLLGHAGSGKDTAADALVAELGFAKLSLADPLKRICEDLFGFSYEQLWGPSQERNKPDPRWDGLTPRKALQTLGTEWGRAMHPDLWIRHALTAAQTLLTGGFNRTVQTPEGLASFWSNEGVPGVVIPDVRFRNEVNAVRDAGGFVIRIVRPGAGATGGVEGHASETEQNEIPAELFAATIANVSSLEVFRADVVNTVRHFVEVLS